MHVFHIRGLSGLLLLILAVVLVLALVTLAPAAYLMVAWNAIVYETFHGPMIGLDQGFLLWGALLVLLKLTLRPDIQVEFQSNLAPFRKSKPAQPEPTPAEEAPEEPAALIEDQAQR